MISFVEQKMSLTSKFGLHVRPRSRRDALRSPAVAARPRSRRDALRVPVATARPASWGGCFPARPFSQK